METLHRPDKDLISRILNEVGFEERIVGYQVRERSGPAMKTMYSFKEVVDFLNDRLPYIDFKELEKWVRNVMKDEQVALKISEIIGQEDNDFDRTKRIRVLMGERLRQCKNEESP